MGLLPADPPPRAAAGAGGAPPAVRRLWRAVSGLDGRQSPSVSGRDRKLVLEPK